MCHSVRLTVARAPEDATFLKIKINNELHYMWWKLQVYGLRLETRCILAAAEASRGSQGCPPFPAPAICHNTRKT
jgi:hypothetical protein